MAELKTKDYGRVGINTEFIEDMTALYDWKKVETADGIADFYVSDTVFFRFETYDYDGRSSIKVSLYKGDVVIKEEKTGGPLFDYSVFETLKTTNDIRIQYYWHSSDGTKTGNEMVYVVTKVKNVDTEEEETAVICTTKHSTTQTSNTAMMISESVTATAARTYTMAQFDARVTGIAPFTHPSSPLVAKTVYTVHSSQLGGVNIHAPVLINNVNYYLYGTLAFRE